jgi:hypothetical protein
MAISPYSRAQYEQTLTDKLPNHAQCQLLHLMQRPWRAGLRKERRVHIAEGNPIPQALDQQALLDPVMLNRSVHDSRFPFLR